MDILDRFINFIKKVWNGTDNPAEEVKEDEPNISKSRGLFDTEMYGNTLGSLVITHYILSVEDNNPLDINKIKIIWASLKKHPERVNFWIDDPQFIPKALALFGINNIQYGRFARVEGDFNVLFAPYKAGKVLPLRENGLAAYTLRNGTVYPVKTLNEVNLDQKIESLSDAYMQLSAFVSLMNQYILSVTGKDPLDIEKKDDDCGSSTESVKATNNTEK